MLANQNGSALLFLLLAVVILGLSVGVAGTSWKTLDQRAKERELLWRGEQYRRAIGFYYQGVGGATVKVYPESFEQLLWDDRWPVPVKHIRRLYPDPMTGGDWEPIRDKQGRIMGVRSSSELPPFQKDGFSVENREFAGKQSYRGWDFIYTPPAKEKKADKMVPAPERTELPQGIPPQRMPPWRRAPRRLDRKRHGTIRL